MSDAFERTVDLVSSHGTDVLCIALRRGGSMADLFAEESAAASVSLRIRRGRPVEDRKTRQHAGAGIHLFDAEDSAYAFTDDLSTDGLSTSAKAAAASFCRSAAKPPPIEQGLLETHADHPPDTLDRASDAEVSALLQRAADAALSLLPDVDVLHVDLQGYSTNFVVASSDGRLVRSSRSTLSLRVHLRGRDGREVHAVGGGAGGLGLFHTQRPEDIAREAAERLDAIPPSETRMAGDHAVVIGGGWGGVWLHEVVGHVLEADVGVYGPERLGERVSGESITVVDDSSPAGGRGGAPVDDEGSAGQRTVLIDEGVLRGLLTDRASALRYGIAETGNGRRQDYRHAPVPRMTNLTLAPGPAAPEDLLLEAGRGLYVKMIGSGRVIPSQDAFSFDVVEGYVIENGRLGAPVAGLSVQGRPSEMLRRIVGIANDFRIDPGRGTCEKKGQVVPVSVGMPTILVDRMTITPRE